MAYELKRSPKICEELILGDKKIKVEISVNAIAQEFYKKYSVLTAAEKKFNSIPSSSEDAQMLAEAMEEYKKAAIELLHLLFGAKSTGQILEFYEENFMEMLIGIIPFITEAIVPAISKNISDIKSKLKKEYGSGSKKSW